MVPAGGWVALVASAMALAGTAAAAQPPAPAIVRDVPRARGTIVLVHAGGWSGPNRARQWDLDWWPGSILRASRWSTRTIDYAAGRAGLGSVSGELRAAEARAGGRPVCIYGESSGAHLALLAAARDPAVDCVIGLGTPTDLQRWRDDAAAEGNTSSLATYAQTAGPAFGMVTVPDEWEPVAQASRIRARVLLAGQADDRVLPIIGQLRAFAAVHRPTDVMMLASGPIRYLHGTLSPGSRASFIARIRRLLRAVAATRRR